MLQFNVSYYFWDTALNQHGVTREKILRKQTLFLHFPSLRNYSELEKLFRTRLRLVRSISIECSKVPLCALAITQTAIVWNCLLKTSSTSNIENNYKV